MKRSDATRWASEFWFDAHFLSDTPHGYARKLSTYATASPPFASIDIQGTSSISSLFPLPVRLVYCAQTMSSMKRSEMTRICHWVRRMALHVRVPALKMFRTPASRSFVPKYCRERAYKLLVRRSCSFASSVARISCYVARIFDPKISRGIWTAGSPRPGLERAIARPGASRRRKLADPSPQTKHRDQQPKHKTYAKI